MFTRLNTSFCWFFNCLNILILHFFLHPLILLMTPSAEFALRTLWFTFDFMLLFRMQSYSQERHSRYTIQWMEVSEGCLKGGAVLLFFSGFHLIFLLPSYYYYLLLDEIFFLFTRLVLQGKPSIFLALFVSKILCKIVESCLFL